MSNCDTNKTSSRVKKLTAKQEAFCREYVIDYCAAKASVRAGYAERTAAITGCKLLMKTNIQEIIKKRQDEKTAAASITVESVLKRIEYVIEKATQEITDKDGNKVLQDNSAALKGCELLGKHLAMWTDKKIVDSTVQVTGIKVEGV